jgi:hypothetical protein
MSDQPSPSNKQGRGTPASASAGDKKKNKKKTGRSAQERSAGNSALPPIQEQTDTRSESEGVRLNRRLMRMGS